MASIFSVAGESLKIVTIEVAPFGFTGSDGKPAGMMFDISNLIAEEAGLKYTNKIVPYARTVIELQSGNADFVLRFDNDKLGAIAVPVASVISFPIIVLSRAGSTFKALKKLHGKTVGVVRGGEFDRNFDNDSAINKYDTNDYSQMIKMLIRGRLDAGIGTNIGLYYNASKLGIKPEVFSPPMNLSSKEFLLHFSKINSNGKTISRLKGTVEKLKKNGEIKKIVNKYMGRFKWDISTK